MAKYILSIDQGTTGTTTLIFDSSFHIHAKATEEFPQHYPKPSWVEHDLEEIWASVCCSVQRALERKQIQPRDIAAIAITNQRETTCLWYRQEKAHPLCRAIVWQDRRTSPHCAILIKGGKESFINRRTGLRLDPYFSATKLSWLLKNVPGARNLARKGKIAFGTVDSYLLYRMSGKHVTDVTNASRTLLMDIRKREWDEDLLRLFGVPRTILPDIYPSAVEYGKTKGFLNFPDGIPIAGIAGDQQAALFGQACFKGGSAKCTYGTGAFVLVNTGNKPVFSKNKLITTVAWQLGSKVTYALEGSAFIAGASVQWLRDGLSLFSQASDIEPLAREVKGSDGVVFVPALSGLGAPHWEPGAKGAILGITRGTTKAHLARATLEGIAFQVSELLEAMGQDFGKRPSPLKVDGGASANDLLMQIQANLLGVEVVRSRIVETTALGSGIQAGLAIGLWRDLSEVEKKLGKVSGLGKQSFYSEITCSNRKCEMDRWNSALKMVKMLARE